MTILLARTEPFTEVEIRDKLFWCLHWWENFKPQNKIQAKFKKQAVSQIKEGHYMCPMDNGTWSNEMLKRHMNIKGLHLSSYLAPENIGKRFVEIG